MAGWVVEPIGVLGAIPGTIGWLPQAVKTIRLRDTRALSLRTNVLLLTTVTLWSSYGFGVGSWLLALGNIVSMVLVGTIVALKIHHG